MSQPGSMSKSLRRRSGTAGQSSALCEQAAGVVASSAAAAAVAEAADERSGAWEKPESEIQNPWNRFQRQKPTKGLVTCSNGCNVSPQPPIWYKALSLDLLICQSGKGGVRKGFRIQVQYLFLSV